MGLTTILGEDNFTSQFYVKKGGDSRKSSLIDLNQDKMTRVSVSYESDTLPQNHCATTRGVYPYLPWRQMRQGQFWGDFIISLTLSINIQKYVNILVILITITIYKLRNMALVLLGLCLYNSSLPIRGGSTMGQGALALPPDSRTLLSPRFKSQLMVLT